MSVIDSLSMAAAVFAGLCCLATAAKPTPPTLWLAGACAVNVFFAVRA